MKQRAWLFLIAFVAVGSACDQKELSPIPSADRVVVGQLKSAEIAGELVEPSEIAALLQVANSHRQGKWSTLPVNHGGGARCSLMLTFMSGERAVGYFALQGHSFFSNSGSGEAERPVSADEVRSFLALVPIGKRPERLQNERCKSP